MQVFKISLQATFRRKDNNNGTHMEHNERDPATAWLIHGGLSLSAYLPITERITASYTNTHLHQKNQGKTTTPLRRHTTLTKPLSNKITIQNKKHVPHNPLPLRLWLLDRIHPSLPLRRQHLHPLSPPQNLHPFPSQIPQE